MNWNQYFKLKERKKKWFWVFFAALFLINLVYIKGFIAKPDSVCGKVDVACYDIKNDISLMADGTNIDNETGINSIVSELNNTINETETITKKNKYLNYLWFDCNFDCNDISIFTKIKIWAYRLIYTPLFILTDIIAAYILSLMIYGYSTFRIEHKGSKKEAPAQKEEKTEKK